MNKVMYLSFVTALTGCSSVGKNGLFGAEEECLDSVQMINQSGFVREVVR